MRRGLFVPFAPAFTHSCNIFLQWGFWLTYHCGSYWHIESKCFFLFLSKEEANMSVNRVFGPHCGVALCAQSPAELLGSSPVVASLTTSNWNPIFFCLILLPCSSCPKTSTNSLLLFMHLQIWNHLRLFSSAAHTSLCPRTWARPVSRLAQVGHMFAGSARVSGWKPARREAEPGQATVWFDR